MVRIRRVLRGEIELGFRRKVGGSPNHLVEMQRVLLKVWAVTVTDEHRLSTCQEPPPQPPSDWRGSFPYPHTAGLFVSQSAEIECYCWSFEVEM
jgi:hypothetical protein